MKLILAISVAVLVAIISPINILTAQQRSAYDLAAWVIAAADDNDTNAIKQALIEGAQIDFKRAGINALHQAIYKNRFEMIEFLLRKGASVDTLNGEGLNALQYAEKIGNQQIIQLLKRNANTNTTAAADNNVLRKKEVKPAKTRDTFTLKSLHIKDHKVGDSVFYSRDRGRTWEYGRIKEINTKLGTDGAPLYLVENRTRTAADYYDANFITTFTRQPLWTSFFVGDWSLQLPIAATERVIDRDLYQVVSGGERLPPLRVNSNGTFVWLISKNRVIRGKWVPNNYAPGIVLLAGDRNVNWLMYNTSDAQNRKIFKNDYTMLVTEAGYTTKHAFRIAR